MIFSKTLDFYKMLMSPIASPRHSTSKYVYFYITLIKNFWDQNFRATLMQDHVGNKFKMFIGKPFNNIYSFKIFTKPVIDTVF